MRRMAIVLVMGLWACGGSGSPSSGLQMTTLGEVADAVAAASASPMPGERLDSDGDSLPDVVERALGTDPFDADTDGDGLVDGFEIFGNGYDPAAPLPDADGDGWIDPLDNDDDGDAVNDGCTVDTDGDGVANCLEYYGYSYDFQKAEFVAWDGDPATPHHFTDPLQPSTDQDAYPDGMEVSKLRLDPTVRSPGDDPLVPAYPNIVCELVGYSVTLNEEIQITQSEWLSEGRTWTRETARTHTHIDETAWEIGPAFDGKPKVSAKYGETSRDTNSTATSVATGESVTSHEGWSQARTTNPTDAARLKLLLKVSNRGTAPISNLVPTLSLAIGGLSVATFEPAGAAVLMLVPGETYPAEPFAHWVIDSKSTGAPLSLTMTELRALELGAPVSISVTQLQGDAMQLRPDSTWERVGDTGQFTARCDAVCANLRIELENGDKVHHLVYADDTPSAPPMTLGAALAKLGVDEDGNLLYLGANGAPVLRSLDGFTFAVDPATLRASGWALMGDGAPETVAPPDFSIGEMRLLPDSDIVIRAPRGAAEPPEPKIHFAVVEDGEIKVSATDYEGIVRVTVHEDDDPSRSQELTEDAPGAGIYTGSADGPDGFEPGAALTVEVTNLAGSKATLGLGTVYEDPSPQKPVIRSVELNLDGNYVVADVESGNPGVANSDILWVRAYHEDFPGGFAEMEPVIDFFRRPDSYIATLPAGFDPGIALEVVAYVGPDVWDSRFVDSDEVTQVATRRQGTITLTAKTDRNPGIFVDDFWWTIPYAVFDRPAGQSAWSESVTRTSGAKAPIPGIPADLAMRVEGVTQFNWAYLYWNAHYTKVPGGDKATYDAIGRDQILSDYTITEGAELKVGSDENAAIKVGDVLVIRTNPEGLPGKLYVESIEYGHDGWHYEAWCTLKLRYVIYEKP